MRTIHAVLAATVCVLTTAAAFAQTTGVTQSVPRLITVSGVFQPADGQPPHPVETITLAIYAAPTGGTPLWQEVQSVALDARGRYTVLLGATLADGIPADVLAAGTEWLGIRFDRVGETEAPRVRLTSVPYALRSADADTLGGRPASAYVLAPTGSGSTTTSSATHTGGTSTMTTSGNSQSPTASPNDVLPGTANYIAKYVDSANVGPGSLFDNGSFVGLGTTTPQDFFHIRFTNTTGSFTGLAVQNLGNTATSYSGTLFYDHLGNLGQFQGFNNITHEYRINNIAQTSGIFNGSINFMIGSTSRFLVTAPGNVGIGTTAPSAILDVSNALIPTSGIANVNVTSYSTFPGSEFIGRKARGTAVAPANAQNGDTLAFFGGRGYGTTGFGPGSSGMEVATAQSWTDTAQATMLNFTTTPAGSTTPTLRLSIASNGNVGIGTGVLGGILVPAANLEVSNANNAAPFGTILGTSFTGTNPAGTLFVGRKARGTLAAPTAVQSGDNLVGFQAEGYGATGFSLTRGGLFVRAAENWTDTAQGTNVMFNTTPTGANTPQPRMIIDPAGNVGIGTLTPQAPLEVSRTGTGAGIISTAYNNGGGDGPFFIAQNARGTPAAPTAVQTGDLLGGFGTSGYGTTSFNDIFAAVAGFAAENFSDATRGSGLLFCTTPLGTKDISVAMSLLPSGNVGIGTPMDVNGLPTATDRLQVFGDVRVGTTGTNGCLKRFDGTGLAGTCVSDRRYKKNITPFGHVLDQLTALQPVHYFWRASEFPEQHFGNAQAYGLIAQDVEQVLPELVVTNADGYKAIDYSKLPLLTIQAVKELKAENDALKKSSLQAVEEMKSENDSLKERMAELERLLMRLLATTSPR